MIEPTVYEEILQTSKEVVKRSQISEKPPRVRRVDLAGLYNMRMLMVQEGRTGPAIYVASEIVFRETRSAITSSSLKAHGKSVCALAVLLRTAASAITGSSSSARSMVSVLIKDLPSAPVHLKRFSAGAPAHPRPKILKDITGMSLNEWNDFAVRVNRATALRSPGDRSLVEVESVDLDVASRLSRMASQGEASEVEKPRYDLSDRALRISSVTVSGFRGSASEVVLDLTRNRKPLDLLLWGDNGVGKSTFVDGIEFALQHRVDRSSDFNSSLRASVRNLTVSEASASVEFSDGSFASRRLVKNKAGRDEPSSYEVRPGFRIAPVVIRRSDILRFLDTDALSRGTIFFDYFPDPAGTLGVRPDEELRQLEEERFLLRVARDDLANQLAELYPDARTNFADWGQLDKFLGTMALAQSTANLDLPEDALPRRARELVSELKGALQRGVKIKKTLERGVESLNPVIYESQLKRVVPILQTITEGLTESFKRVTRADHILAIKVLVAKSGPVSLDVVVDFDNGTSALPQQAFSEGYKDLIALLFFLTVTKKASEYGQARVLVLDDALQSVDSSVRVGLMQYILEEFRDWQLIITGHDRAWLAQVRGLFQRAGRGFVERGIAQWSFSEGIVVSGASRTRAGSLSEAIDRGDERLVAAGLGVLLEEVSSELSWRMEISLTRRRGDQYTLGDLWPGVAKVLKKTSLSELAANISSRLEIRNIVGAHYNDWADSVAWSDIRSLGVDVLKLYEASHCSECGGWVEKVEVGFACSCSQLSLA